MKGSRVEIRIKRDDSPNIITSKPDSAERYEGNLLITKSEQNNEK